MGVYAYASRPIFNCKACGRQFSVAIGTIFTSRKLPIRDYLLPIAIFVNGADGRARASALTQPVGVHKTAFVLAHKLREAVAAKQKGETLFGEVEIEGAYLAVTSGRRTGKRTVTTAVWRSTRPASGAAWSPCASAAAQPCPLLSPWKMKRFPWSARSSRRAASSMPTNLRHGMFYMPAMTPSASTMALRSATMEPA